MRSPKLLGHPAHPPLVHFPLGLWGVVPVWDGLALFGAPGPWPALAFWCLIAGLILALPAAATGLADFAGLERDHPAEPAAYKHMFAMICAAGLFAASALVRRGAAAIEPARLHWAFCLGLVGAGAMSLGGWLGGELVYRFGVGRTE